MKIIKTIYIESDIVNRINTLVGKREFSELVTNLLESYYEAKTNKEKNKDKTNEEKIKDLDKQRNELLEKISKDAKEIQNTIAKTKEAEFNNIVKETKTKMDKLLDYYSEILKTSDEEKKQRIFKEYLLYCQNNNITYSNNTLRNYLTNILNYKEGYDHGYIIFDPEEKLTTKNGERR